VQRGQASGSSFTRKRRESKQAKQKSTRELQTPFEVMSARQFWPIYAIAALFCKVSDSVVFDKLSPSFWCQQVVFLIARVHH